MSFTLSHPAASLPLKRALGPAGVASALFIGSIVPDFALFLPFVHRDQTHHGLGILWFCVPMGCLTWILFHAFCRPMGVFLLPAPMRARLQPTPVRWLPDCPWWAVGISILVGAITHVVWDSFTHPGEGMVVRWELLQCEVLHLARHTIYVHTLLQHGGTLVGLAVVGFWVLQWYWRTPRQPESGSWQMPAMWRWPLRICLVVPATIGGMAFGLRNLGRETGLSALHTFLFFAAVSSMGLLVVTWLSLGILWRWAEAGSQSSANGQ